MIRLVLALTFLFLTHYGISSTGIRDRMVARLGEMPYRGVYSLISIVAFVLLVLAYRGGPYVERVAGPGVALRPHLRRELAR